MPTVSPAKMNGIVKPMVNILPKEEKLIPVKAMANANEMANQAFPSSLNSNAENLIWS